jgi:hypothetical protein
MRLKFLLNYVRAATIAQRPAASCSITLHPPIIRIPIIRIRVQIPIWSGRVFRHEASYGNDTKPVAIPI